MSNPIGVYIHIPFCRSKCAYCDFYSGSASESDYDKYCAELKRKIEYWGEKTCEAVQSVYFGGGTPSVLGAERLISILKTVKKSFSILNGAEITLEVNPESGKTLDFEALKNAGFNRVSIGLQSADVKELKTLGRIHSPKEAELTVLNARKAGIENISLDLMMGIPYQTKVSLKASIDFCAKLNVKHISSYILKIEEGTRFYSIKEKLELPDEDKQAELYLFAVDYLGKLGYKQYEISNFSVPGFESRHNTLYWKCGEYIGIGPSAHSFYKGRRFYYPRDIKSFYENQTVFDCKGGGEVEFIMLALRLKSGLSFTEFEKKYKHPLPLSFMNKAKKYADLGYLELKGDNLSFTPKGFLVSNTILSDLI